jgi:K+-transporting ATPase KdpF subunit
MIAAEIIFIQSKIPSTGYIIGAVIGFLILALLIYSLIKPEKF